jgi:hypothetical protein
VRNPATEGRVIDTIRLEVMGRVRAQQTVPARHPFIHFKFGASGNGKAMFLIAVECSLPKLLWGHNGRLISTQPELDEALERLWHAANLIAMIPPRTRCNPTRIDLVAKHLLLPAYGAFKGRRLGFKSLTGNLTFWPVTLPVCLRAIGQE